MKNTKFSLLCLTGSDTIIAGLESAFLGPKSAQYYCSNCVGTSNIFSNFFFFNAL